MSQPEPPPPDAARSAGTAHSPGADVTVAALDADPYPIYARLQREAPICRIESLGLWYVTRYEDVRAIALDHVRFTTAFERSPVYDTFGLQMLTAEGATHDRYRRAVQARFTPGFVRQAYEAGIRAAATRLVEEFRARGEVELRSAYAARLPVLTMLELYGLPLADEPRLRTWFDAFERSLANFRGDPGVRAQGLAAIAEFHAYLDEFLRSDRGHGSASLLAALRDAPAGERLADDEIRRNATIVLFGGISTVEALILNALWALFEQPATLARVSADPTLLARAIDETIRWAGPVQSATRHVVGEVEYGGVRFADGDVVNCMLAAANRDPAVFPEPERFDIDRGNLQRHLGFAVGTHGCLGLHLAKAEGRVAVECLLALLPGLRRVAARSSPPVGSEFRQPRALTVAWDA